MAGVGFEIAGGRVARHAGGGEADAELQRLNLLKKNHLDEQYVARRSVRDLPDTITNLTGRLADLTADMATTTAKAEASPSPAHFPMVDVIGTKVSCPKNR